MSLSGSDPAADSTTGERCRSTSRLLTVIGVGVHLWRKNKKAGGVRSMSFVRQWERQMRWWTCLLCFASTAREIRTGESGSGLDASPAHRVGETPFGRDIGVEGVIAGSLVRVSRVLRVTPAGALAEEEYHVRYAGCPTIQDVPGQGQERARNQGASAGRALPALRRRDR